jgi:ABC-type microcin C transport system permease subunit YejB
LIWATAFFSPKRDGFGGRQIAGVHELGLWTFLLTYLICIPLGIAKAVRDGSRFDAISSLLILIGYAIPGL